MAQSREVGNNIRQARGSKGMSQKELAKAVNVRQQSVARWEAGKGISSENLVRVADVLDVPIDYLTRGAVSRRDMADALLAVAAESFERATELDDRISQITRDGADYPVDLFEEYSRYRAQGMAAQRQLERLQDHDQPGSLDRETMRAVWSLVERLLALPEDDVIEVVAELQGFLDLRKVPRPKAAPESALDEAFDALTELVTGLGGGPRRSERGPQPRRS